MNEMQSLLMRSAKTGDAAGVDVALQQGARVDLVEEDFSGGKEGGRAALHHASEKGHLDVVNLLLDFKAKVDIMSKMNKDYGATPLLLASGAGHTHVMEHLLRAAANKEAEDDKGKRAVHWAAAQGQLDALKLLKVSGCNLQPRSNSGATVLHYAALDGDLNLVRWLVANGVKCEVKDKRNSLAKDVAKKHGHPDVHRYLKDQSPSKGGFGKFIRSPLKSSSGRFKSHDEPLFTRGHSGRKETSRPDLHLREQLPSTGLGTASFEERDLESLNPDNTDLATDSHLTPPQPSSSHTRPTMTPMLTTQPMSSPLGTSPGHEFTRQTHSHTDPPLLAAYIGGDLGGFEDKRSGSKRLLFNRKSTRKHQLRDMEEIVVMLKDSLTAKERQNSQLQNDLSQTEHQKIAAEQLVETLRHQLLQQHREQQDLRQRFLQLTHQNNEFRRKIEQLERRQIDMVTTDSTKDETISTCDSHIQELTRMLSESRDQLAAYQSQKLDRETQYHHQDSANRHTIDTLEKEVERLSHLLRENEEKYLLHCQETTNVAKRDVSVADKLATLSTEVEHLTFKPDEASRGQQGRRTDDSLEQERLKNTVEHLEQNLNKMSNDVKQYEKMVICYKDQLRNKEREHKERETVLKEEMERLSQSLQRERNITKQHQEQTQQLLQHAAADEKTIDDLNNKLIARTTRMKEYEQFISSHQDQFRDKTAYGKREVANLQAITFLKEEVERLTQSLDGERPATQTRQDKNIEELISRMETEQHERQKERENSDHEIARLTSLLDEAKQKLAEQSVATTPTRHRRRQGSYRKTELDSVVVMPSGLPNLGNTCYINCVIQCLFNITTLRDYFTQDTYRRELNRSSAQKGEVALALAGVFKALHSGVEKEILKKINRLKTVVGDLNEDFRGSQQREAHDLLLELLIWLHNDLVNVSGSSLVSERFQGSQESIIRCDRYPEETICRTQEPFTCLTLAVNQCCSLQELVENHYRIQKLEWDCQFCSHTHLCRHTTRITRLPQFLIFHLSRYDCPLINLYLSLTSTRNDIQSTWGKKINVTFPQDQLSLQEYMMQPNQSPRYELLGIVNHRGTTTSGHYTAYCRSLQDNTWRLYNDDTAEATDKTVGEELMEKCSHNVELTEKCSHDVSKHLDD
ncbi:Ubiquitin carboxyl-terminal hydrolase 8-like 5 [Homarus americanus]|uniref:Ubiquitin carboxyl-terminal hydrolase 8-like 5 n=1 Tax=Homarus americanus TaxID=6706 RepID=A0A8J5K541_HOMAM|nr:Ubiquitin carboxyl-terminal hydrolase 8-like 5 [Homarus americanus]